MNIGLILEDDNQYTDRKGREYYIDYVLNQSSIRQWSLSELADYGFDKNTGIWAECPGYSCGVVADYADFVYFHDSFRFNHFQFGFCSRFLFSMMSPEGIGYR